MPISIKIGQIWTSIEDLSDRVTIFDVKYPDVYFHKVGDTKVVKVAASVFCNSYRKD